MSACFIMYLLLSFLDLSQKAVQASKVCLCNSSKHERVLVWIQGHQQVIADLKGNGRLAGYLHRVQEEGDSQE